MKELQIKVSQFMRNAIQRRSSAPKKSNDTEDNDSDLNRNLDAEDINNLNN